MTTTQHTPGPWRVIMPGSKKQCFVIMSRENREITRSHHSEDTQFADYQPLLKDFEANARLIAAAPDLLAELKRVAEDYIGEDDRWCVNRAIEIGDLIRKHNL